MFSTNSLKVLLAAGAVALVAGGANAASVACSTLSPDVTDFVVPNVGCEVLTSDDNDSNTSVDGMFSVSDWTQIAKVDPLPGTNGPLTISGTAQLGTWTIADSVFSAWESVMLVFKGPNLNAGVEPGSVVGYLLQASSGEYETPFAKPKSGEFNPQNISHVSLYVSGPAPVPLPAAGFLMIGALGGLAALRRRRRAV